MQLPGKRGSKYHNHLVRFEGQVFQSKRELKRWHELRFLESQGIIDSLERQVKFTLDVNGVHICNYLADFVYQENGLVVEDAKGFRTEGFRLKKKLMKACHGITIKEV